MTVNKGSVAAGQYFRYFQGMNKTPQEVPNHVGAKLRTRVFNARVIGTEALLMDKEPVNVCEKTADFAAQLVSCYNKMS